MSFNIKRKHVMMTFYGKFQISTKCLAGKMSSLSLDVLLVELGPDREESGV